VRRHRSAGRDALRPWAEELYRRHGAAIASLVGSEAVPEIRIAVVESGRWAAWTNGRVVTLNARWFAEHPDDAGGCLHEFTHAVMRAPGRDPTAWLIEGIADYVREALGFDAPWTFAHYEPDGATAGYQTTAHFLLWLEARRPGAVAEIARRLSTGRYEDTAFAELCGAPLEDLVARYEGEQTG
jgi:hypothetical protein